MTIIGIGPVNKDTGANEGALGKLRRSLQMDAGGGVYISISPFFSDGALAFYF
jgi:hypothetical protein